MTSTRSLIAAVAGFSALGFLLMALIYWAVFTGASFSLQSIDWTLRILLIAAIVSFSIYLVVAPESVARTATKRSTKLTANALFASLVAAAIAVVVNIIVGTVPTVRADWTAEQQFSLSPQTKSVLADLDARGANVVAVAFYGQNSPQRQTAEDLLKEYASYTGRLRYEFVDPLVNPERAISLGVRREGLTVFVSGEKRETAESAEERDFTSALIRLAQNKVNTVAFVTGHGERDPNGFEQDGYSQIRSSLEQNNYQISTVNLITATLNPSDTTALIIAEPQRPYAQQEVETVQRYLDDGGRLMLLLDPFMPAEARDSLKPVLDKYGVEVVQGGVIDLQRILNPQNLTDIIVTNYGTSDITSELSRNRFAVRFFLSMAVRPPTSTVEGFSVQTLVESSTSAPESWLETSIEPNPSEAIQLRYDEGTDLPGPVSMGVSVAPQEPATGTVTDTTRPGTRLVVYGDADWASNGLLQGSQNVANIDLFGNSISWLSGNDELVSIRPREQSGPRTVLLDANQKNLLFVLTVLGLPLFVFLLGLFNWWRRR